DLAALPAPRSSEVLASMHAFFPDLRACSVPTATPQDLTTTGWKRRGRSHPAHRHRGGPGPGFSACPTASGAVRETENFLPSPTGQPTARPQGLQTKSIVEVAPGRTV